MFAPPATVALLPPPPAAAVVIGALRGASPALRTRLLGQRMGGLVLYAELGDGGRLLRTELRAARSDPVLVIDQEGGAVRRVRWLGPAAPPVLGRLPPARTRSSFRSAGAGLLRLGVDVDLAPVADVARGGATASRSFGSMPRAVGRRAAAAVEGLGLAGVGACVKHFPGLGSARVSSDRGVSSDRRSRAAILADLQAFAAPIAAGAGCLMVSSVIVPALCRLPAMLCPSTYARIRRMGFHGAIITDALDAPALRPYGSPGWIAVRALRAGADAVLASSPAATLASIAAVEHALRRGLLGRGALAVRAARLAALHAT